MHTDDIYVTATIMIMATLIFEIVNITDGVAMISKVVTCHGCCHYGQELAEQACDCFATSDGDTSPASQCCLYGQRLPEQSIRRLGYEICQGHGVCDGSNTATHS